MEKQLNLNLKLTLQDIALRRVAVSVWNETDILALIEKCHFRSYSDRKFCVWRETFENKIKDKVSKLVLPESLKKQIMHLLTPMRMDTVTWKMYHEKLLSDSREYFDIRILEKLRRSSTGAIDYGKTAEELVRHEMFDVVKRYRLACLYCLVDYIAVLWEKIPNDYRLHFYNEDNSLPIMQGQLEFFWPYILKGEEAKLDRTLGVSCYRYAFENSARKGNKAAAQYFFRKLPREEQESCLFRTVDAVVRGRRYSIFRSQLDSPIEKICDVVSYLLSLMSPEQQMQLLKDRPYEVFRCFLDWPLRDQFLDIADVIWTFYPESRYDELLSLFVASVRHSNHYSSDFFQEFFLRSPASFRKQFLFYRNSLFIDFFSAEDTETLKVVFRNVEVEDRVRLVFDYNFFKLLSSSVMADKWHLVEVCLREATLSKEDLKKLKWTFMIHLTGTDPRGTRLRKRKWRMFFRFFEETIASTTNKRNSEGEMLTRAKKNKPCNE